MVEDRNSGIESQEEFKGHLEASRNKALENRIRSPLDVNYVSHVFTFQSPKNSAARMVAYLRASLFTQEVGGGIFETEGKNAFIVDIGTMTDSEYEKYHSQQEERDRRLLTQETLLEDESLRRLKSQAGSTVQSFPFIFNMSRDLQPEDAVKSIDEVLKEFTDVVSQARAEEIGPISDKTVEINWLRSGYFIVEFISAKLNQAIRESISHSGEPPTSDDIDH